MAKDLFCHKCNDYREINIIQRKETYPVKGEKIEITSIVSLCKQCGEELFDEELDEENLERAYDLYRKKHGLLYPVERQ